MHVYTSVWLKLKQVEFSIDSRITPAHTFYQIGLDFAFCAGARFISRGREPEVEGRRRQHLSSEITVRKILFV